MAISLKSTVNAVSPSAAHASGGATADLVATDLTAVSDAITAAAANVTIAGDVTALGLVTAISTALGTLNTDIGTVDLSTAISGDVVLTFNPVTVISKNNLRACVAAILKCVEGSNDLT